MLEIEFKLLPYVGQSKLPGDIQQKVLAETFAFLRNHVTQCEQTLNIIYSNYIRQKRYFADNSCTEHYYSKKRLWASKKKQLAKIISKLTFSEETSLEAQDNSDTPVMYRVRSRYSLPCDNWRFDVTFVFTVFHNRFFQETHLQTLVNNVLKKHPESTTETIEHLKNITTKFPQYTIEFELEYTGKQHINSDYASNYNVFASEAEQIIEKLNIESLFALDITKIEYSKALEFVAEYSKLPSHSFGSVINSVRNFTQETWWHEILPNINNYCVTNKADGERNLLIFTGTDMYLLGSMLKTQIPFKLNNNKHFSFILDGELIHDTSSGTYLAFDILYFAYGNKKFNVSNFAFQQRIAMLPSVNKICSMITWPKNFKITMKKFTPLTEYAIKAPDDTFLFLDLRQNHVVIGNQVHIITSHNFKSEFVVGFRGELDNKYFNVHSVCAYENPKQKNKLTPDTYDLFLKRIRSCKLEFSELIVSFDNLSSVEITHDNLAKQMYASNLSLSKHIANVSDAKYVYQTDGLIFSNTLQPYATTLNYKWKPEKHLTIDFLCLRLTRNIKFAKKNGYLLLCSTNSWMRRNLRINSKTLLRRSMLDAKLNSSKDYFPEMFFPSLDQTAGVFYSDKPDLNLKVCELSFDVSARTWKFHRVRHDKDPFSFMPSFGNSMQTAEEVFSLAHNPFRLSDFQVKLKTAYFQTHESELHIALRTFSNFVKKTIFSQHVKYGHKVLDLACGKGQDFIKLTNLGTDVYIGIDSDANAITECCRRKFKVARDKHSSYMDIRLAQFDLTKPFDKLKQYLSDRGTQIEKCNVVCMNFALHYFWQKNKLKNLLKTVSKSICNGGVFIVTCFDGKKVFDLLQNGTYEKYQNGQLKYQLTQLTDADKFDSFGIQVRVKLPFGTYTETLIDLDILEQYCHPAKLLSSQSFADFFDDFESEKFVMSDDDKEYLSLYRVMVFHYGSTKKKNNSFTKLVNLPKQEFYFVNVVK